MQQFNMKQKEKYKETELALLPESWKVVRLGDLIESVSEKNKLNQTLVVYTVSNKFGFVKSDDFFSKKVYSKKLNAYKYVMRQYFAYNPYRVNVGSIGLFDKEIGLVSPAYVVFKIKDECILEPYFLFRLLKSPVYMSEIKRFSMSKGSVRRSLSFNDLANFKIPFPSLSEQKKITSTLSTIQEAKEKTENVINSLKELKKSIMKYLFTYGPVSLEKAEKVKLKETEIGMVPEGWDIIPLKEIAYFKNGINFEAEQKGEKGILTIGVLNMYGPEISVHLHKLYRVNKEIKKDYLLQDNDILFVRSSLKREGVGWTTLFKKINEPVTYCGFLIRARLNNEDFDAEYLTNYLRTNIARSNLVSSSGKVAITNINQGMLGNIEVPKPNKDIQLQISSILSIMDLKIRVEENKKKALEKLFKSMLNNLMTAKIRVNNLEI